MPGMVTPWMVAAALLVSPGPNGAVALPDGAPVPVRVGLYVVDISDINETSSTFGVDLEVVSEWKDDRLAFTGTEAHTYVGERAEELRKTIWLPRISAVNGLGDLHFGGVTILVEPDGTVLFRARVEAQLRAPLDFHEFPFDRQVLPIVLESFAWDASELEIIPDPNHDGFDPAFQLPEWQIVDVRASSGIQSREGDGVSFSRMRFEIEVRRQTGYYLWKVLLPLVIVVLITWIVFYMSEEALGRRAGVSSTGVLTVIAYQFVVSSALPRVPYLTQMDLMTLCSVAIIGATMLVNLLVDRTRRSSPERARTIDRICRWLFPLLYFGLLALIFGPVV